MAKEEENYITIVNLKEENQKLQRQLKQQPLQKSNSLSTGSADRELAKLSVENELLRKQVESMQQQSPSKADEMPKNASPPSTREVEDLKLKLRMTREELEAAKTLDKERAQIETALVDAKLKSANLDLEND